MIEITMPRLSDTMEEGAIATWHKHAGDRVEVGEILVEIETDKATMEYEAYDAGTLAEILVNEGETVSIGTPIALLDNGPGTGSAPGVAAVASAATTLTTLTTLTAPAATALAEHAPRALTPAVVGDHQFASPLVRKLAREHHLDLGLVSGTGPGGRIIRTDIEGLLAAPSGAVAPAVPAPAKTFTPATVAGALTGASEAMNLKRGSQAVAFSKVRRVIARRLSESARSIPHFYVTAVADAEALVQLRTGLNEQFLATGRAKVSINDLLVRACALALREHPLVNASYVDDESTSMLVHEKINIGVAVATEGGLVVPVIEDADRKSVTELGAEAKQLATLATTKGLSLAQMSGGTFTISNLGMYGVEQFTAIINPPEGAILAVGVTAREPVIVGDDVVLHHRMRYTLSADHRIIDGAMAAQFLQTLTRLIESPLALIV